MSHHVDFDRFLRDHQAFTPAQQAEFVRRAIAAANAERAAAMRKYLAAFGRWAGRTVLRGLIGLLRAGVAIARGIVSAWEYYHNAQDRRREAMRLYAMDDRMLRDMGLTRGDIGLVVNGVKDPTRLPRPPRLTRDPLETLRPKPDPIIKPTDQRAAAPLVLRKACAG